MHAACWHKLATPASIAEALSRRGLVAAVGAGLEQERPWLADHIHTPAAQDFAPNATRKRPLIYV